MCGGVTHRSGIPCRGGWRYLFLHDRSTGD
jgi:hypothetical protein